MPRFSIVRKIALQETYRTSKIMADFDVQIVHLNKTIEGEIILPEKWQIGVICGASGTGKSTIANELYKDELREQYRYGDGAIVDDMPKSASMREIENMFYAVGLGSVPSWLKPYGVLSTGEKMRTDIARSLLSSDFCVFDEFTSVVDRNVAETLCLALSKTLKKYPEKKIICVSCHKDILSWLDTDWIFDTDIMSMREKQPRKKKVTISGAVRERSGEDFRPIII